jgi:hypothetical protein
VIDIDADAGQAADFEVFCKATGGTEYSMIMSNSIWSTDALIRADLGLSLKGKGLLVGDGHPALGSMPAEQDAHIENDARVGGGLWVGSLTGNPGVGSLYVEGNAVFGGDGTGAHYIYLRGAVGNHRAIRFQTGTTDRWWIRTNDDAESGSDAGSNFQIVSRDDSGAFLATPIEITRSNSKVKFAAGAEVSSNDWNTYSHNVQGFSSTTSDNVYYKRIGKTLFMSIDISGTSNATGLTFTLPNAVASLRMTHILRIRDNGTWAIGYGTTAASGTTFSVQATITGGSFTASGTKSVRGLVVYQTT